MSECLRTESSKRILILTNNDVGLYRFRADLIKELVSSGCCVNISLPRGELTGEIEKLGCGVVLTPLDRRGMNPFRDISLFFRYRALLGETKPDLVVTYTVKPNIYGGIACRIAHIPYASNITGLGSAIENGGALKKFVLFLYRIALRDAKVVFFENTSNRDALCAEGAVPQGRDVVLGGAGVNLDDYPYIEYPRDTDGTVRFLFVGRVMREKGVNELFAAAEMMKKEYGERAQFHVVGSFEEACKPVMDALEERGIVKYHGYQSNVKKFYAMASCVVLPSYHEGMSNVLLEAAASGRPLITSDIPGCREAADDGVSGFLCEPKSADGLYAAMKKFMLLSAAEREQMGRAGRRRIENRFSKRAVVAQTIRSLELSNE